MGDDVDQAQAREEAREKTRKKTRKTTTIELPGNATVDVDDKEAEKEQQSPAAPEAEVGGDEAAESKPNEASGAPVGAAKPDAAKPEAGGVSEAPKTVKPKPAKITKCQVCGQEVKAQGIGAHMRRVHPELMELQGKGGKSGVVDKNSEAAGEDKKEVKEGGFSFEELVKNPVAVAVGVGVGLLVLLIAALLVFKPKASDTTSIESTSPGIVDEPGSNNNIPLSPMEQKALTPAKAPPMEEQEGKTFEAPGADGKMWLWKVVKDHASGEYNPSPIKQLEF